MAFIIPSIEELKTRGIADLIAAYAGDLGVIDNQGQLAIIAGSIEDALVTSNTGQTFGNYTLLEHIARQATPVTATLNSEEDPFGTLQDWGIAFNTPIKLATGSTGNIDATFTAATTVPEGTQWQANDGTVLETTEEVIIAGAGVFLLPAKSQDVGESTNLAEADQLSAIDTVPNMDSNALVSTGGFTGGQEDEEQEAFRARLLISIRGHSEGSQLDRYLVAALRAPGVTRVFGDERAPARGAVTIRFMMDDVREAFNGIPQGTDGIIPTGPIATGDQKLVEDEIIAAEIRPPAADIHTVAPVEKLVVVELSALNPNTPEVQQAVTDEVKDLFRRETEPGKVLSRSQISAAISAAKGEISHTLLSPATDVTPTAGELPVLDNGIVVFPP